MADELCPFPTYTDQGSGNLAPFAELAHFVVDAASVQLLGYGFCKKKHVVVLGMVDPQADAPVTVGMTDPEDDALRRGLERFLHRPLNPVRLNAYEIQKALDIGYGKWDPDDDRTRLRLRPVDDVEFDPAHPAHSMLDDLLGRAITLGASDVHIERYPDDVDVRVRVDGVLHQLPTPISVENAAAVTTQLKTIAGLDPQRRDAPQHGRLTAAFRDGDDERTVRFRVSMIPGPEGEDAVLHVLDRRQRRLPLSELGLEDDVLGAVQAMLANPEGLVLVTGPTGSGKTTTLYAMIEATNTDRNKILSIEDPIEHRLPKVNQKQVDATMGFSDYAYAFLRQDPDVVMLGELRDDATADAAMRAGLMGHLVLAGLLANDAVGAVARLGRLDVDASTAAEVLLGTACQRLLRRVCDGCARPATPDAFANALFARLQRTFASTEGAGCERCNGTGYDGRTGVFEVMVIDATLRDLVGRGAPLSELRKTARRRGMRSLVETALARVEAGVTTLGELRRCIPVRLLTEPLAHEL